jgi:hypothetical protein
MHKIKFLLFVSLAMLLLATNGVAQRETRVEQQHAYSEDEKNDLNDYAGPGFVDWAVYFKYPSNVSRVVVNSRGEVERAVLSRSTIDDNFMYKGERYVKVLTGRTARTEAKYRGNRQSWANSLRLVYYQPFQPRGPENRGRRP